MQYGQIVFLLFIVLLFYYAALIVLDIMKSKAAQAAELESQSEEDIDISDEAQTFKPTKINREESNKDNESKEEMTSDSKLSDADSTSDNVTKSNEESEVKKPFKRPGHREPIMTDGILVEDLINEINKLTETAACDLGLVIIDCENAR